MIMSDFGININITLNASPVIIDAMMSLVELLSDSAISPCTCTTQTPQVIENETQELQDIPKWNSQKPYTIQEVPPFSDFTTHDPIDLPLQSKHLQYAETHDGRVMIHYLTGTVYTTWDEILKAHDLNSKTKTRIIVTGSGGNRFTAINQFLKAVTAGLQPGQGTPRELEDPDADFRPHLKGVIDTSTRYDGNKIEMGA